MAGRTGRSSLDQRALSRSKIELFLECPRCFYLDVRQRVRRPSGPPFTLNNAVDALLKAEFDGYRARRQPHPLFGPAGIEAVPFSHPELDRWRANFTGVRWADPETGWTFFGAVDDVWTEPSGRLIVADYKATAKAQAPTAQTLFPSYPRQVEVYQFLLRQKGFEVSDRAWFVYANGDAKAGTFGGNLRFDLALIPYDGNAGWVLETWRRAVAAVSSECAPEPKLDCEWCQYRRRAEQVGGD
ncbi:MAG: PD-(D/E)XK nuclease family protein [Nevskiales bacterium]|nr:PD-(D/E)XK nuclease family protein [Nevskiales bacterium]